MQVNTLVQMQKDQLADVQAVILAERTLELQMMLSATHASTHPSPLLIQAALVQVNKLLQA